MAEPRLVVAIDGPGGSGKSSVGAGAALRLGYRFCDTGVLYRGLTWLALERGVDPDDAPGLMALVRHIELAADGDGRYVRLRADGSDVTDQLHTAAVDRDVSRVSRHAPVRASLLPIQRALAAQGGIIMAGRDIGTVVLPDADLKIYLDVSLEERARRRAEERGIAPDDPEMETIRAELRRRDGIDTTRETAPLRQPADAIVVSSEGNTLDQTVERVVEVIRHAASSRAQGRGEPPVPRRALPGYLRFTATVVRFVLSAIARVRVTGLENVPRTGAVIVVANHLSNADPPLVAGWLTPALGRQMHILAKASLFVPLLGSILRRVGATPVRAGGSDIEAYRIAREVLERGDVLCIFPEGTRSATGALGEPKPGVAMLATRTGVPVLPVGISGTDRLLGRGQRFPRIGTRIEMRVGAPFAVVLDPGLPRRQATAAASAEIMRRIAALTDERHRGRYGRSIGGPSEAE